MKILFNGFAELIPGKESLLLGGPRIFTQQLISYLKKNQISFVAFCVTNTQEFGDSFDVQKIRDGSGYWVDAKMNLNTRPVVNTKTTEVAHLLHRPLQNMTVLIAREKPDVVFLSGYSMLNWYIMKASYALNIPVVMSHHGLWFKELDKYNIAPDSAGVTIMRQMEKDITKSTAHEIFLNEFSLREYQINLIPVPLSKRSIIPISYNSVYLNSRPVPKKAGKKLKIGFSGRWDPIKNPQIFLEIAKEAKKQKKNWEFHAICKIGNVQALAKIENQFKRYIKIVKELPPIEMKKFYQEMDLLIAPSRFDVSPTVVLEAALQHRPTLISQNVGWSSLYKKFNMEQWIHDFKDIKQVVEDIEILSKQKLSDKYVDYLIQHNSSEAVMAAHVETFRSVIKTPVLATKKIELKRVLA